jgi:hypothetical protein
VWACGVPHTRGLHTLTSYVHLTTSEFSSMLQQKAIEESLEISCGPTNVSNT